MQSDYKEIYRLTSLDNPGTEQEYKDIGNFVFAKLYSELKRPKSLIIKLKGIGFWYLRRKRMDTIINDYPPDFDKKPEDFASSNQLLKYENRIEIFNIFKERLKDYEQYIEERNQVRKKRYETQTLLSPNNDKV